MNSLAHRKKFCAMISLRQVVSSIEEDSGSSAQTMAISSALQFRGILLCTGIQISVTRKCPGRGSGDISWRSWSYSQHSTEIVDEDSLSSPVYCHYFHLQHATIIRLSVIKVQIQFPRVDSATNSAIKFSVIGVPGGRPCWGSSRPCSESESENPRQNNISQGDNRCPVEKQDQSSISRNDQMGWSANEAVSLVAVNLVTCLEKSSVECQLITSKKAFVGVVLRAPVIRNNHW